MWQFEDVSLVRLNSQNRGLLSDIADDVFDGPISSDRLTEYLSASTNMLVLAVVNGQVVGQVAAYLQGHPDQSRDLYIDNLGVTPSLRRRGIARRLVVAILDWGKFLHCNNAWIVTERANRAAMGLYASLGAKGEPTVMFSYQLR